MSVSIYTWGYNNSSMQGKESDTKSLSRTTDEEEMKRAEFQQSVGTARLTKENIRQDGTVSLTQRMQGTEAYRQIKAGQTEQPLSEELTAGQLHTETVRMDKMEISEEGKKANAEMQQKTASDGIEYKVENLSEYTDIELKQMYYRGEITLQEYEDETGEIIE